MRYPDPDPHSVVVNSMQFAGLEPGMVFLTPNLSGHTLGHYWIDPAGRLFFVGRAVRARHTTFSATLRLSNGPRWSLIREARVTFQKGVLKSCSWIDQGPTARFVLT